MISPLPRPVIPTVQKEPIAPAPPPPPPPATSAPSYFKDAMEKARPNLLDIQGQAPTPGISDLFADALASVGPPLLHLGAGWTPQGQGYDARRNELLTTYYAEGQGVLLSLQDKDSGQETHQVQLGGKQPVGPPTHGGGVSTDGEFIYVSDTRHIYVYKREDLEKAEKTFTDVPAFQVMEVPSGDGLTDPATGIGLVSSGSYMTVKDGYAYVGGYSKDGDGKVGAVWRYKVDEKTGELIEDSRQGPIRAPDRAQGVAVVDGALLFTTGDKKLVYQPFEATESSFTADIQDRVDLSNGKIDPYAQGLNVIDGELWVTYESGSHKYRDNVKNPRESIQRIPLEELDLAAGCLTPEDLKG